MNVRDMKECVLERKGMAKVKMKQYHDKRAKYRSFQTWCCLSTSNARQDGDCLGRPVPSIRENFYRVDIPGVRFFTVTC